MPENSDPLVAAVIGLNPAHSLGAYGRGELTYVDVIRNGEFAERSWVYRAAELTVSKRAEAVSLLRQLRLPWDATLTSVMVVRPVPLPGKSYVPLESLRVTRMHTSSSLRLNAFARQDFLKPRSQQASLILMEWSANLWVAGLAKGKDRGGPELHRSGKVFSPAAVGSMVKTVTGDNIDIPRTVTLHPTYAASVELAAATGSALRHALSSKVASIGRGPWVEAIRMDTPARFNLTNVKNAAPHYSLQPDGPWTRWSPEVGDQPSGVALNLSDRALQGLRLNPVVAIAALREAVSVTYTLRGRYPNNRLLSSTQPHMDRADTLGKAALNGLDLTETQRAQVEKSFFALAGLAELPPTAIEGLTLTGSEGAEVT